MVQNGPAPDTNVVFEVAFSMKYQIIENNKYSLAENNKCF